MRCIMFVQSVPRFCCFQHYFQEKKLSLDKYTQPETGNHDSRLVATQLTKLRTPLFSFRTSSSKWLMDNICTIAEKVNILF